MGALSGPGGWLWTWAVFVGVGWVLVVVVVVDGVGEGRRVVTRLTQVTGVPREKSSALTKHTINTNKRLVSVRRSKNE